MNKAKTLEFVKKYTMIIDDYSAYVFIIENLQMDHQKSRMAFPLYT